MLYQVTGDGIVEFFIQAPNEDIAHKKFNTGWTDRVKNPLKPTFTVIKDLTHFLQLAPDEFILNEDVSM